MRNMKWCALVILAMCCRIATAQTVAAPDFVTRILTLHNAERARYGEQPLIWNPKLAEDAQIWANDLARTRRFEHAPEKPNSALEGENLWMGTAHAFTPEEMVDAWLAERKDFINGMFPHVSRTGNWHDVGHYTQIIWANTHQVGCAMATNAHDDFLVCRYLEPGNWDDERTYNSDEHIKNSEISQHL